MDNKPTYAELKKRVDELEQSNAACQQLIAELRQSEDRFRQLWEQSPLGYQSLDAQGRFVEVNQSWIDTLGYAREEVIGRSFAEFLHPDWQEHFRLNFPRFKAVGEVLGLEFEMVKKDGSLITVSFNGKISRDDDGQFRQTHCVLHDITERKEAEVALQLSEERFAKAFATNPSAICLTGMADSHIVDANPAFSRIFGFTREEYTGRTILELGLWPTPQDREAAVAELRSKGFFRDRHQTMLTKSGEEREFLASAEAIRIGDEPMIVSTWLDITDQKRAEEALRESEEQFRVLTQNLVSAVALINEHGEISIVNRAFLRLFNLAEDDNILNINSYDWSHWQVFDEGGRLLDVDEHPVRKAARTHKAVRDMLVAMQCPGCTDRKWLLISTEPILNAQGNLHRLICTYHDITERKQAEEALRESERRLSMAVTATADAIWEWNLVTNQTYYSPRWFAMLGYEYNEISMDFDGWKSLCHPDDLQSTLDLIQSRLKSVDDAGYAAEFRMRSKDGAWVWILGRGRVVERDEAGKPVLLSGTNTDITERKEAEEAVRQLNESLELQVIERTAIADVRSKQLQALAVELIETEERERRQFADLLHDDLQQMLAAAKMQVQAVAETLPSAPMLSDAVQLLDQSIAKSRRLSHQLSPAILHQGRLITALGWLSRQVREQFGLHVELDIETELLMERTPQKAFLFRAVQELLFNSVKHAGVKSARVTVSSSEDSITVTVSDQGRGFDTQLLETRTGNLGLGLLTIKERAGYVGGTFVIESAPGQGSHFTLTVPNAAAIGEEEAALGIVEEPTHSRPDATISGAGGIRVLFVDDHRVMRQGLINLVKSQPAIHVAGEASNGREAIEQAHKLLPDVILMDVSMPEMDGIEATRRIKEELPHVRIIGLTMHDEEQIRASMNQAGAEVTLSKTLSAAEVVKAIYGSIE